MSKKKIVIASILKPVDDTRMFEKFGISLGQTNKYEINIIGFCSKKYFTGANITIYPLYSFKRLSFKRLFASIPYFFTLLRISPSLIIVTTPELLPATCFYKTFKKCKLIYDVQENYKFNILYNQVYPGMAKHSLAFFVRKIETFFSRYVDHFFLAEKVYEQELNFIKNHYSVIANKYKPILAETSSKIQNSDFTTYLYTGTIARNYGIFLAIDFVKAIYKHDQKTRLIIAGYCQEKSILKRLRKETSGCNYITLIGGDELVPHRKIDELIRSSDYGLVPYQPDASIENKIPTKLYEYMANRLPLILQNHDIWVALCSKFNAAVVIDYNNIVPTEILETLGSKSFYTSGDTNDLLWNSEEKKLLEVVDLVLDQNKKADDNA